MEHVPKVLLEEVEDIDLTKMSDEEIATFLATNSEDLVKINRLVIENPDLFNLDIDPSKTWMEALTLKITRWIEFQRLYQINLPKNVIRHKRVPLEEMVRLAKAA